MSLRWTTFSQAMAETECQRRHLLLGNGFSIGAHTQFRYESLVAEARSQDLAIDRLFFALGAGDFEGAMALTSSRATRDQLRKSFFSTIASIHPKRHQSLRTEQREYCASFLSNFVRTRNHDYRGRLFTTNYDVMLYWVLVEHRKMLNCWDGFDDGSHAASGDFLWHERWMTEDRRKPLIWYLHGGLHIYETGSREPQTFKLRGTADLAGGLVDIIKVFGRRGHLPLLVSENSAAKKLVIIKKHPYLHLGLKKFWLICRAEEDALFTFGHSLGEVDHHITDLVGLGKIRRVYIGVRGERAEHRASQLAVEWAQQRTLRGKPPIDLQVFPASEVPVWEAG